MIENTVTKTTESATVVLNNRPAINAFASIESDGKYNFNFNVTLSLALEDLDVALSGQEAVAYDLLMDQLEKETKGEDE
jgi:hypothetical protein